GFLLIFWMIIRIIKSFGLPDNMVIMLWYLYYVPMIFIPYLYYKSTNYIFNKNKIFNIIAFIISLILVAFVLTNNYHSLVFKISSDFSVTGDYTYNFMYYIICIWTFYLLIKSIILLIIKKVKNEGFSYKIIFPILLILLGISYTYLYAIEFSFFRQTNMAVIIGIMLCLGVEVQLYLNFIPNNNKYKKLFVNSNLNINIVSKDGKNIYTTKSNNKLPNSILKDIISGNVKDKYSFNNYVYNVIELKNEYVIIIDDLNNIRLLENKIKNTNKELLKQKEALETEKKLAIKLNQLELKAKVFDELERNIKTRKNEIEKILTKKNINSDDLKKIKMFIAYCKRQSSLIISEFNNEYFTKEGIELIVNELLYDFKDSNLTSGVMVDKINISSNDMSKIYEIIFSILECITDDSIYISIYIKNDLTIKISLDGNDNFKNKIKFDKNIKIEEKKYDNEKTYIFKIMERKI
ncbi:MAG: hypothetical protein Q4G04_06145, partial [bacterium]|nr:hypothetical protein [bacterium]